MSAKVLHLERALTVHSSLIGLLGDWERLGTHDVMVAGGPGWPNGGLRTDVLVQHQAFVNGLTKARTLAETAHGRGAALDIWPVDFNPHKSFDEQPGMKDLMIVFGEFAEARNFVFGGRWTFQDYPHVELPHWRLLPYPPVVS